MGKKSSTVFVCQSCGSTHQRWSGKCSECDSWGTIQEEAVVELKFGAKSSTKTTSEMKVRKVSDFTVDFESERIKTTDQQIDTLLGGGFVQGSVILLAGQPGIGKSTLLLQLAHGVSKQQPVLYVSGEESQNQVAMRARRLGTDSTELSLASTVITDDIVASILTESYRLVVIDSIQTIGCRDILSAPGTVSQITNSTMMLMQAAKQANTTLIIVGHVTKDGSIAGPKLLEHSVDVVLHFEGDRYGGFKILRSVKNRFGSTHESAIYHMEQDGLRTVDNPSAALLEERRAIDGSIVLATMEGSRPLLVEVQALVTKTSYGYPKRTASGFDLNRLNLLIAVMERRANVSLSDKDVYINIVGGIDAAETAADLAVCLAIASAAKGKGLVKNYAVFGEIGLGGEIRFVPHTEKRMKEAIKLGFEGVISPYMNSSKKSDYILPARTVAQAIKDFIL